MFHVFAVSQSVSCPFLTPGAGYVGLGELRAGLIQNLIEGSIQIPQISFLLLKALSLLREAVLRADQWLCKWAVALHGGLKSRGRMEVRAWLDGPYHEPMESWTVGAPCVQMGKLRQNAPLPG